MMSTGQLLIQPVTPDCTASDGAVVVSAEVVVDHPSIQVCYVYLELLCWYYKTSFGHFIPH